MATTLVAAGAKHDDDTDTMTIIGLARGISLANVRYHFFYYANDKQIYEEWVDGDSTKTSWTLEFPGLSPSTNYTLKIQMWKYDGVKDYEIECEDVYFNQLKINYTNIDEPESVYRYNKNSLNLTLALKDAPTRKRYVFYKWKFTSTGGEFDAKTNVALWCPGEYTFEAEWNEAPGGTVWIYTSSGWRQAQPYIYSGGAWNESAPFIYDGSSWREVGG